MTRRLIPARTASAVAALSLALAACGGGDDATDAEDATEDTASASGQADESDDGATASDDDAELGADTSRRPDWTPVWLLLPDDLVITIAPNDPSVGEAYITGFVVGGDLQDLYDKAWFMVQSGGYVIGEESEGPGSGIGLETEVPGKDFSAAHTSDGSVVNFGIYQADAQRVQWNIQFLNLPQN